MKVAAAKLGLVMKYLLKKAIFAAKRLVAARESEFLVAHSEAVAIV